MVWGGGNGPPPEGIPNDLYPNTAILHWIWLKHAKSHMVNLQTLWCSNRKSMRARRWSAFILESNYKEYIAWVGVLRTTCNPQTDLDSIIMKIIPSDKVIGRSTVLKIEWISLKMKEKWGFEFGRKLWDCYISVKVTKEKFGGQFWNRSHAALSEPISVFFFKVM